jgi:protein-S-isoprenylcysteine O-methyltransferase Ste14
MRTLFVAVRALVFMAGFIALWGWVAWSLRAFDPLIGMTLPAWTATAGAALMIPGAVLALWCGGEFVTRGRGTPAPFDAPREFVAAGPYRFVRNPMYLGGWVLLMGFGMYARSVSILLLSCLLLLVAHLFVVFFEEPTLRKQFGTTYEAYCRNVRRWIPRGPRLNQPHGTQTI